MSGIRRFGLFWYDFVVGDDWLLAAGIVVALVTAALLTSAGWAAGWVTLPILVIATLVVSIRRAVPTRDEPPPS